MSKSNLFTLRRRKRILSTIRKGRTLAQAAESAGIAARTLDQWIHRGRESAPGTVWRAFSDDVDQARQEAEAEAAKLWGNGEVIEVQLRWPEDGGVIPFPGAWEGKDDDE